MMDVDFVPEHLVIVGGSYVGLEFAQMYRRFGSEVTIIEKGPRLIAREDEDVSAAIAEIVEREGIHLRLNAECIRFEQGGNGPVAGVNCTVGSPDVPGIWALGDCNGRGGFTHTSYNDFEIVADNLLDGASRRVSDRITTYALF